ncbi:MAG: peptidylprolyl isomerase [Candidatus Omnitrophica bacterium]|nr:peptidylprolyl isomerase [Candidatus Omnitrophota bacterium]
MKQRSKYFTSISFLILWLFLLMDICFISQARAERRELVDKVVAVVDEEAITQSELDELLNPIYEQYRKQYQGEDLFRKLDEARRILLNQLIEDRLVYQESKRAGVKMAEEEVDASVNDFKDRFQNDAEFNKLLKEEGMTMTKLRERYERQIAIRKLHQYEVRGKVMVSPKEVEQYYKDHINEFATNERIQVRTITIRKSPEAVEKGLTDETAKAKAEAVLKELIDTKADFAELAKRYSQDSYALEGGELGFIERGDMVEAIDQALFSLKKGELSQVLESKLGYHIFRVDDIQAGKVQALDEMRGNIQGIIYREKMRKRFVEWMEQLKKEAYISIR